VIILPVTLVIAAAAALINIWLAVRVTGVRKAHGIWLGDGGNEAVVARTRAHTNFVEYAPFVLILLALIELASGASLWLWGAGVLFILARLAHGIGMDSSAPRWMRSFGAITTLIVLLILSGWALAIGYQAAASRPPAERTITFGAPKA
jgi:uncharacterized membrane protein YecN with MAPEG domain